MDFSNQGPVYVWAWPDHARGTEASQVEADYYTEMTAAAGSAQASWYGSKALKWGASPERVALALVAVAS
jgi:hypothetical protein